LQGPIKAILKWGFLLPEVLSGPNQFTNTCGHKIYVIVSCK